MFYSNKKYLLNNKINYSFIEPLLNPSKTYNLNSSSIISNPPIKSNVLSYFSASVKALVVSALIPPSSIFAAFKFKS